MDAWVILAYLSVASAVYLIRLALTQGGECEKEPSEDTEFRLQQLEIKAEELAKTSLDLQEKDRLLDNRVNNLKTSLELQKGAPRGR